VWKLLRTDPLVAIQVVASQEFFTHDIHSAGLLRFEPRSLTIQKRCDSIKWKYHAQMYNDTSVIE
jgi:hypothetical protein